MPFMGTSRQCRLKSINNHGIYGILRAVAVSVNIVIGNLVFKFKPELNVFKKF